MDFHKQFQDMMAAHSDMALATSGDGVPSVRIVSFYYDAQKKVLYFATFKDSAKCVELEKNPIVSFTTLPKGEEQPIRVRKATAKKSALSIHDVKDLFIQKIPAYANIVAIAADALCVYEISFDKAVVTLDVTNVQEISV